MRISHQLGPRRLVGKSHPFGKDGKTPGIWDLRDESVPGGLDPIRPSNRRQNLRLLWHVLMFVDAYAVHGLFGRTSQKKNHAKKGKR